MRHNDSTPLTAAQLAKFDPTVIARVIVACGRAAVSGDHAAHVEREGLIAAWCELHDCDRARAISDIVRIDVEGYAARKTP